MITNCQERHLAFLDILKEETKWDILSDMQSMGFSSAHPSLPEIIERVQQILTDLSPLNENTFCSLKEFVVIALEDSLQLGEGFSRSMNATYKKICDYFLIVPFIVVIMSMLDQCPLQGSLLLTRIYREIPRNENTILVEDALDMYFAIINKLNESILLEMEDTSD